MYRRIVFLMGLYAGLCHLCFSQALPHFGHVTSHARVELIDTSGMFLYSYEVTNDVGNSASIWAFEVDISRRPSTFFPDTSGLQFANTYIRFSFDLSYPLVHSRIIPVGFPVLPARWDAGLAKNLTASFSTNKMFPEPSQGVSLEMVANWPPTIRKFIVVPYFDVGEYFPSIEDSNAATPEYIDSVREAMNYVGLTLGPGSIDSPFVALTFLDTIKSYINQSRTLGWITTQGTADKYTALITSAQSNLSSSPPQRGVAKAKLDSVLVNVYPDSSAGLITSEAYALLRFNTEYVLKKLREEDEQGKDIEGKEK